MSSQRSPQQTQADRSTMLRVWPHELFRIDFDQILEQGKRQEEIHLANRGEFSLVQNMHAYFRDEVMPLVFHDDWVCEAASQFALEYAMDCFHFLRLSGQEVYSAQKDMLELKEKIVAFLARAYEAGAVPQAGTIDLPKVSDFLALIEPGKLPSDMRSESMRLHGEAVEREILSLKVTLRGIRGSYETLLPRVMYVVRRAIKVTLGLPPRPSDNELSGISSYISWYTARVVSDHPLYPVLGELRGFYRVARNVGSHHRGLEWRPETNEVLLSDNTTVLRMPSHEFQQKFRHLVYLCDLGLRGILSAFCQWEQGAAANRLVSEYVKSFPEDFPEGQLGAVRCYPT